MTERTRPFETAGILSLNMSVDENDRLRASVEQARTHVPDLRTRIHGLLNPLPGAGDVSEIRSVPLGKYQTQRDMKIHAIYEPDIHTRRTGVEEQRNIYIDVEGFKSFEIGGEEAFVSCETATHPHDPTRLTSITMVDLLHLEALLDLYESTPQDDQEAPIHEIPGAIS